MSDYPVTRPLGSHTRQIECIISMMVHMMREVIVQQVRLDPSRRLRVTPTPPQRPGPYYVYIYRDASGVAWDDVTGEFYVRQDHECNPVDDFRRIAAALEREYAEKLTISPSTSYIDVPSGIIDALRQIATS